MAETRRNSSNRSTIWADDVILLFVFLSRPYRIIPQVSPHNRTTEMGAPHDRRVFLLVKL